MVALLPSLPPVPVGSRLDPRGKGRARGRGHRRRGRLFVEQMIPNDWVGGDEGERHRASGEREQAGRGERRDATLPHFLGKCDLMSVNTGPVKHPG